jgi:protein gp37
MSDGTSIEWADATWQPVVGCTRCAPGCEHCYAIGTVHRFRKADGLTKLRGREASRPGLDWSGKVLLQSERLGDPLRWKRARRVFVCSQADLFHPAVPFEYIAAVFGVMAACPQHTFLVLTKRPERAQEFFAWASQQHPMPGPQHTALQRECFRCATNWLGDEGEPNTRWPLPNVHLGASVSDQATADANVPALLACPAALHWLSAEPLLGPVDLVATSMRSAMRIDAPQIRWVVVGGESGPGARPFHLEWARSLIEQCQAAGVAVFVKQLGARPHSSSMDDKRHCGDTMLPSPFRMILVDRKGGDSHEWPDDIRVREMPR